MLLSLHQRIRAAIREAARKLWDIEVPEIVLDQTPKLKLGELATPICMGLARTLKTAPRAIAGELVSALTIDGVRRIEVAGTGYINLHLDRGALFRDSWRELHTGDFAAFSPEDGKVVVEHTNINPNKAAHIGHLRNAAIGDAFVRILRFTGHTVEVQNYIDDTGVQVADVIVGFLYLERRTLDEVRALIEATDGKFDYYCWDLYARVSRFYESEDPERARREEVLRAIEEGGTPTAAMAEAVAMAVVRCHLQTMERMGVRYDVLPREGDILQLKFWERTFTLLKERKAVLLEREGRNAGCWIMRVKTDSGEEDKIIIRSNGTVTYVGKDIAYQLWKLGLLDQEFLYRVFQRYADGTPVWVTDSRNGEPDHPAFGGGTLVYTVVDVRQSYLQTVVREGVRALGYDREAGRSVHFSYEMVALTPACARQLGVTLSDEESRKAYVEVSGRKGQGVKADDLLDILEEKALGEVERRNPEFSGEEQAAIARQIAAGALRYFLLRFTRTTVIAFDFEEALNFDGETGPYLQYAAVRASNILKKAEQAGGGLSAADIEALLNGAQAAVLLEESDDLWELVYTAARLDEMARQAAASLEPATLARFAFLLAQKFSLFYHAHRVLSEADPDRRRLYLAVVDFVRRSLTETLALMGISVPVRM